MKLREYLNESTPKVRAGTDGITFESGESIEIPEARDVVLIGNAPKPSNVVMVYRDKSGKIKTEDGKGNKETFEMPRQLQTYLNKNGFVYFEGYSRF